MRGLRTAKKDVFLLLEGADDMDKDFKIENEKLYTIREAAEICGVSRATLLRMEEAGLDAPRYVDKSNGYRYYDVVNIHCIKLYQMLQLMGLSNKEICSYFDGNMMSGDFLATLQDRLSVARRCFEEFQARLIPRGTLRYEYAEFPAVTCYTFTAPMSKPKDQIEYNYREIKKMYDLGFKPAASIPMFSVVPGTDRVYGESAEDKGVTICVAIDPEYIPDRSCVRSFPLRNSFSLLYKGNDDEIMSNGADMLLEEMKQRGIVAKGPCYGICVLGPFFGTRIDPDDYVFRWAIPVD